MEYKNLQNSDNRENKGREGEFWKGFGAFAFALALAVFTVVIVFL